jgi:hypothetical protein
MSSGNESLYTVFDGFIHDDKRECRLVCVIVVSKQAAIFDAEDTASILSGEDINASELPIRHN